MVEPIEVSDRLWTELDANVKYLMVHNSRFHISVASPTMKYIKIFIEKDGGEKEMYAIGIGHVSVHLYMSAGSIVKFSFEGSYTSSSIRSFQCGNKIEVSGDKMTSNDQLTDQLMELSRDDLINRLLKAVEALDFYGNTKFYYKRPIETDMNLTSAVFKEDYVKNHDLTKPNIVRSESYECSARIKVDQGKRAREAREKCLEGIE